MTAAVKELIERVKDLDDDDFRQFLAAYADWVDPEFKRLRQESHDRFVAEGLTEEDVDALIDRELAAVRRERST